MTTAKTKATVSVGPTTIVGWVTSLLAFLPVAISQIISFIENNQAKFSGSEKLMVILGGVTLVVTLVGRYLQSLKG